MPMQRIKVLGAIVLITMFFITGCDVSGKEDRYQKGIAYIQQENWKDAAVKFVSLHASSTDSYKDSYVLYTYCSGKRNVAAGAYKMANFEMSSISDKYSGEFASDILAFKQEVADLAQNMTPEQIQKENQVKDQMIADARATVAQNKGTTSTTYTTDKIKTELDRILVKGENKDNLSVAYKIRDVKQIDTNEFSVMIYSDIGNATNFSGNTYQILDYINSDLTSKTNVKFFEISVQYFSKINGESTRVVTYQIPRESIQPILDYGSKDGNPLATLKKTDGITKEKSLDKI